MGGRASIATSSSASDLAVDASGVYWANDLKPGGSILHVGLAGGTTTQLAGNLSGPVAVALGSDAVYWINSGTNEIMKIAK